jgi:hypothetical protein
MPRRQETKPGSDAKRGTPGPPIVFVDLLAPQNESRRRRNRIERAS